MPSFPATLRWFLDSNNVPRDFLANSLKIRRKNGIEAAMMVTAVSVPDQMRRSADVNVKSDDLELPVMK
jgi:hypothetical protein